MKKTDKTKAVKMPEIKAFPSIRVGDKNGYVTVAQANLQNRGYDIGKDGVDGIFGEDLKRAVKEFQKDIGMKIPNGSIGPKTWAAIQESKVNRLPKAPEPIPVATPSCKVVIDGLTRYQADMFAKILSGGLHCEVVTD